MIGIGMRTPAGRKIDNACPIQDRFPGYASLPPAVFSFIVAESYQQEPDKVAGIVMLGNIAALGFVPLGLWLGL